MNLVPINLAEANEFVRRHHRHHGTVRGAKFSIAVADGGGITGDAVGTGRLQCAHGGFQAEEGTNGLPGR